MVHLFLRKKDGSFVARQEVRFKLPGSYVGDARAVTNPHLIDWDGDGHTDLVVGHFEGWAEGAWTLYVCAGPLAGKTELAAKAFALAKVPDARPVYFGFADWDGDGRFDLLAAVRYQKGSDGVRGDPLKRTSEPVSYAIYCYRNTTAKGEPKFAPPIRLLTIPAPWVLEAFSVVDRDLVVSASKNLYQDWMDGNFYVESQLWRYRRRGYRARHGSPALIPSPPKLFRGNKQGQRTPSASAIAVSS
jgi:hypothetical protein